MSIVTKKITIDSTTASASLLFSGTNYVSGGSSYNAYTIGTLEAWIRNVATDTGDRIVIGVRPQFLIYLSNRLLSTFDYGSVATRISSVDLSADFGWHHIALVFEFGTTNNKLYFDGLPVLSNFSMSAGGTANAFAVGGTPDFPSSGFNGYIDDVRLWNIRRTDAEILANYTIQISSTTSGLTGYWLFNENAGTTVVNQVNGGPSLTFEGTPPVWSDGRTSSVTNITSLSVSGGMGISGNINSGNLSGQTISTSSTISASNHLKKTDGANEGTIDQISTELTFSSSGNKVALSNGNSLIFKNDNSRQLSAFTGRHKIDPTDIHGFMRTRTIIKQTFSLQNPGLVLVGVGGGNILSYNLGTLRKGQVIQGVFFWVNAARASGSHIGIYSQSNVTLVASTPSNIAIVEGMNYIAFSSPYTIPTTQVYFLSAIIPSGVLGVSMNAHNYFNYGFSAVTGALRANTQYTNSVYATLPASYAGVAMTTSNFNVFVGVYG